MGVHPCTRGHDYEAEARAERPQRISILHLALMVAGQTGQSADAALDRLGHHDAAAEEIAQEALGNFYEALMAVIDCNSVFASSKDFSAYLDRLVAAAAEPP